VPLTMSPSPREGEATHRFNQALRESRFRPVRRVPAAVRAAGTSDLGQDQGSAAGDDRPAEAVSLDRSGEE